MGFFEKYFIQPIIERTGYNLVNTICYAIIALLALYVIWKEGKKRKVRFDLNFFKKVFPFVLFGSTLRAVVDSVDANVFHASPFHEFLLNLHIYDYSFITVSPGIYLLVAGLFFLALFLEKKIKVRAETIGILLFLFHFLLLLPLFKYYYVLIPILFLLIPALLAGIFFKEKLLIVMILAQTLDGAVTFYAIDLFEHGNYREQHVFPNLLAKETGSFFSFYLIKFLLSFVIALYLKNQVKDENEREFYAIVISILGFAPGIRNLLRMMVGV